MSQGFKLLSLSLFVAFQVSAAPKCENLFPEEKAPLTSKEERKNFLSLIEKDSQHFKVDDFLSPEFIKQVEEKLGPIELRSYLSYPTSRLTGKLNSNVGDHSYYYNERVGADSGLSIKLSTGFKKIIDFTIHFKKDAKDVVIENLNLRNPLNEKKNLHLSQGSKGLPMPEVQRSMKFVKTFLKEHGFKDLYGMPMNLLVSYLYRKSMGLAPTKESAQIYQIFDDLISERHISLSDLNWSLGDVNTPNALTEKALKIIGKEKNLSALELAGYTPLSKNGHLIGYTLQEEGRTFILILNPNEKAKDSILSWPILFENHKDYIQLFQHL